MLKRQARSNSHCVTRATMLQHTAADDGDTSSSCEERHDCEERWNEEPTATPESIRMAGVAGIGTSVVLPMYWMPSRETLRERPPPTPWAASFWQLPFAAARPAADACRRRSSPDESPNAGARQRLEEEGLAVSPSSDVNGATFEPRFRGPAGC